MVSMHIEFPSGSGLNNYWDDGIEIANETPVNSIRCRPRTHLGCPTHAAVGGVVSWLTFRSDRIVLI